MGYVVLSKNDQPVRAIGPVTADRAEWFFAFNSYEQRDPQGNPGVFTFKEKPEISGQFQETLPEGLVARPLQVML